MPEKIIPSDKRDLSNMHSLEVMVALLEEKGILTKKEVLDWLQKTVEEKTQAKTIDKTKEGESEAGVVDSPEMKNWKNLMGELDSQMPRNVEDIYDALRLYGVSLETFAPFAQEAYLAKKEARKRRPV